MILALLESELNATPGVFAGGCCLEGERGDDPRKRQCSMQIEMNLAAHFDFPLSLTKKRW